MRIQPVRQGLFARSGAGTPRVGPSGPCRRPTPALTSPGPRDRPARGGVDGPGPQEELPSGAGRRRKQMALKSNRLAEGPRSLNPGVLPPPPPTRTGFGRPSSSKEPNGPTSRETGAILGGRSVLMIPDVLADAGGVTVSCFEWGVGPAHPPPPSTAAQLRANRRAHAPVLRFARDRARRPASRSRRAWAKYAASAPCLPPDRDALPPCWSLLDFRG